MNTKNKNHQAFRKPFWALLGVSIGCLALLYGGVVWAVFSDAIQCTENQEWCIKLGVKGAITTNDVPADVRKTVGITQETTFKETHGDFPRLQITNNHASKEYFVPLKSQKERAAFLNAREGLGVEVCVEGSGYGTSGSVSGVALPWCGEGAEGEEGAECIINTITGQQCRVKNGVTDWSIVNTKRWKDGTNFAWTTPQKVNGRYDKNYELYNGSKVKNVRCGWNADHGKYGWNPNGPDGKWALYRCEVDHSSCDWGYCGERWKLVTTSSQKSADREYATKSINVNNYPTPRTYGTQCTEGYYAFTGTYTDTCYYEQGEGTGPGNQVSIFGTAHAILPADFESGSYDCQRPCSEYNRWSKVGTTPYAPSGCTSNGYSFTRIGACYNSCNNTSTCTNDSNCELYNDGSTSKEYSEACTFDWQTGGWEANAWEKCKLNYVYGNNDRTVTKYRTVTCVDEEGANAPYTKCNSDDRPDSTAFCDASDKKYYWRENGTWCNAVCEDGLTCPAGKITVEASGNNVTNYSCMEVIGNTEKEVPDAKCNGINKPYTNNNDTCTKQCICIDTGGGQI